MKTNKDYYEQAKNKGQLHSQLKDGKPKGSFQKIIAMGYPITVLIMGIVTGIWTFLRKEDMKWKVFWPFITLTTISGYMWGWFILKADPDYTSWLFYPWTSVGEIFGMCIEDWLFYPICSTLFYLIYRKYKSTSVSKDITKIWFMIIAILFTQFFLYFTDLCGRILAIQSAIFGLLLIFYVWDRLDVKHFLKFAVFMILFAGIWDYIAVSLLAKHWAWCSHWAYITFDISGMHYHSSVYLDYGRYPWAWILNNPIEITPWLAISTSYYIYFIIASLDKLFFPKTTLSDKLFSVK